MTNKEAINYLVLNFPDEIEAVNLAVDALEKAEKYKWHDLRKDPSDLPTLKELVEVICDWGMRYTHAKLSTCNNKYYWIEETPNEIFELLKIEVIAWRYIEPFEVGK